MFFTYTVPCPYMEYRSNNFFTACFMSTYEKPLMSTRQHLVAIKGNFYLNADSHIL